MPIDNNAQERLLRSHVVGRKTWYGTHSEQGAETAAILFSIVETCKLNGENPREYFPDLIKDLLDGKKACTRTVEIAKNLKKQACFQIPTRFMSGLHTPFLGKCLLSSSTHLVSSMTKH